MEAPLSCEFRRSANEPCPDPQVFAAEGGLPASKAWDYHQRNGDTTNFRCETLYLVAWSWFGGAKRDQRVTGMGRA
jgi:hypothetical protein